MKKILEYFPDITENQINQFEKLEELYKFWNDKINVISRKNIDQLYINHVLHSLAIAKVMEFKEGSSVLDVGTGGGFPGIPLAILFPDVKFHLVDSIGKKITVVNAVKEALNLQNVKAEKKRAEDIHDKYDFIVSRAVTAMPKFVSWINGKFKTQNINPKENGILYLKGGDLQEELESFPKAELYDIKDFFDAEFYDTKKVVYIKAKDL